MPNHCHLFRKKRDSSRLIPHLKNNRTIALIQSACLKIVQCFNMSSSCQHHYSLNHLAVITCMLALLILLTAIRFLAKRRIWKTSRKVSILPFLNINPTLPCSIILVVKSLLGRHQLHHTFHIHKNTPYGKSYESKHPSQLMMHHDLSVYLRCQVYIPSLCGGLCFYGRGILRPLNLSAFLDLQSFFKYPT